MPVPHSEHTHLRLLVVIIAFLLIVVIIAILLLIVIIAILLIVLIIAIILIVMRIITILLHRYYDRDRRLRTTANIHA